MTTQRMHLVQAPVHADGIESIPTVIFGGIESIPTVIIGGGQAGLVMGYRLQQAGERFVILDAQPRIGDTWRNRWDSLRLFSFPKYSSLPGWRIPVSSFPTHNEMADYLEAYAHRFNLPVRSGVRATRLSRNGDGFRLSTTAGELLCNRVVIATGGFQTPIVPEFAAELTPEIGRAALLRLPESGTAGGKGFGGRSGKLGRRDRFGRGQIRSSDVAFWQASGRRFRSASKLAKLGSWCRL